LFIYNIMSYSSYQEVDLTSVFEKELERTNNKEKLLSIGNMNIYVDIEKRIGNQYIYLVVTADTKPETNKGVIYLLPDGLKLSKYMDVMRKIGNARNEKRATRIIY